MKSKIVLAGGRGFLGQVLAAHFLERGWDVMVLTRAPRATTNGIQEIWWDGKSLGEWTSALEGASAVINLAGVSVNCRYHARNQRRLVDSRVLPTRILGEAIRECVRPPKVWFNSSTATIYKHTFGPAWDESGEIGAHPDAKDAFSIEIATTWEREFEAAQTPGTRKIALRSAMVLGLGANSVFPMLHRLVRFGLGGTMAGGRQYVSWIHEFDFCLALDWLMDHEAISGVVNLAAPTPVTNREMMSTLRELSRVSIGLPATGWMLEVGAFVLRTETELIIKSRRVVSKRLSDGGFTFRYRTMREAMTELLSRTGKE
jgi:uncharacterized protein (TIGR01777 family)